ncbi:MAG: hypothetical protein AAF830_00950 [Pseudomonadota bacterium]
MFEQGVRALLKPWLVEELLTENDAIRVADQLGFVRITDAEERADAEPSGKLPFEDFDVWWVPHNAVVRASWASFLIPLPGHGVGRMTMTEVWAVEGTERDWFDLLVEIVGFDPAGKREEAPGVMSWNWVQDLRSGPEGPKDFWAVRSVVLPDGVTKLSSIWTRVSAAV